MGRGLQKGIESTVHQLLAFAGWETSLHLVLKSLREVSKRPILVRGPLGRLAGGDGERARRSGTGS
jgi:hypothetical protein